MNITKKNKIARPTTQAIALVAHDHCKLALLDWATSNRKTLQRHPLFATGTTGQLLSRELDLDVTLLQSGPLGGDQQIGAKIVDGKIGLLTFFWDPLECQPHDPDVRALLRLAVLWNIPTACNRATADLLIASKLLQTDLRHDKQGTLNDARMSKRSTPKKEKLIHKTGTKIKYARKKIGRQKKAPHNARLF